MTAIALRPYQQEAIAQARAALRAGRRRILICAPTGAGKCLGFGTPVLMFDGRIKPVEDVRTGDLLMGPDSTPRTVLSTTVGHGPLYRVTPCKGDSYVVNDAHILSLKMTRGATKHDCSKSDQYAAGKIHNIRVTDYLAKSATFRHCAKGWRTGVDFAPQQEILPLDAYFLGVWLGDGNARGASVCSPDPEILDCVHAVAQAHGLRVRVQPQEGNASVMAHICGQKGGSAGGNAVLNKLRDLGVLNGKHIPHAYLTASRADRLQLLAGLLDTDGHMSSGGFDFVQKEAWLAKQVMFLARSLGFAAYGSDAVKMCSNTGACGLYYRVSISGHCDRIPVRIARKKAPPRRIKKDPLLVGLSVQAIGEGSYAGFEIDGDRLFMLGDFTVTHNTVIASALMQSCVQKGKRAAFVVDRVNLIAQTSAMLERYRLAHGVVQASHVRRRMYEPIQVCSVQTLQRRPWPLSDLDIFDEAHVLHKTHKKRLQQGDSIVIGLTATPFTRGLGQWFDAVVNVTTTRELIAQGWLAPYRIYSCAEPDMAGVAIKSTGEWAEKEASSRALQVVGDVVAEYQKHGQGRKFICSAVDVAHVQELQRQFLAAGIHAQAYTYKEEDEGRAQVVEAFRQPGSSIRGLITVTAASRGFDVPDIGCVIMARPLRTSLAEHIQLFGRGLRTAEGKSDCLVLDHSGNCARFWHECEAFFDSGAQALDDGTGRARKKPKAPQEREALKCPHCRALHMPAKHCPHCGHEYPKKAAVAHVAGSLKALLATYGDGARLGHAAARAAITHDLWPQICGHVLAFREGDAARKMALALFKEITGVWPAASFEQTRPLAPSKEVRSKIRSLQIRYIHSIRKTGSACPQEARA